MQHVAERGREGEGQKGKERQEREGERKGWQKDNDKHKFKVVKEKEID